MIPDKQFYTQGEIVVKLHDEGYTDISTRTLIYWRSENLLPPLTKLSNGINTYHYTVIDTIRTLADNSIRKTSPVNLVAEIELEDRKFLVHKIEITRHENGLKMSCHTIDGILVLPLSEEELNAITR